MLTSVDGQIRNYFPKKRFEYILKGLNASKKKKFFVESTLNCSLFQKWISKNGTHRRKFRMDIRRSALEGPSHHVRRSAKNGAKKGEEARPCVRVRVRVRGSDSCFY